MAEHYILEGHEPVPADLMTWARWFENATNRRVAETHVGDMRISTVFLGLDHNFAGGPPLLFESLVFDGTLDGEMERYTTWEEAEEGHTRLVNRVRAREGD